MRLFKDLDTVSIEQTIVVRNLLRNKPYTWRLVEMAENLDIYGLRSKIVLSIHCERRHDKMKSRNISVEALLNMPLRVSD
jgi:hypothetical protein